MATDAPVKATSVSNKPSEPPTDRWEVRLSHPAERKRRVFTSVSESRARAYIVNRYPRGEEAYLVGPGGKIESYQQERTGPYGEDAEKWAPFDPESYQPPEEAAAPGQNAWADVEG